MWICAAQRCMMNAWGGETELKLDLSFSSQTHRSAHTRRRLNSQTQADPTYYTHHITLFFIRSQPVTAPCLRATWLTTALCTINPLRPRVGWLAHHRAHTRRRLNSQTQADPTGCKYNITLFFIWSQPVTACVTVTAATREDMRTSRHAVETSTLTAHSNHTRLPLAGFKRSSFE